MPRQQRIVIPSEAHHIIQRGNMQRQIFFSPEDRIFYLDLLNDYSQKHKLDIIAYCLMTNHLHIIAIPKSKSALADVFKPLHTRYVQRINRIFKWEGHLLQGRFLSVPMDEAHCWVCVRYVEQNPLRAGMVANAEEYIWSSAMHHCGLNKDPLISSGSHYSGILDDWQKLLKEYPDAVKVERIRKRINTGFPCGSDDFVAKISRKEKRQLVERSKGRPSKNKKK